MRLVLADQEHLWDISAGQEEGMCFRLCFWHRTLFLWSLKHKGRYILKYLVEVIGKNKPEKILTKEKDTIIHLISTNLA